MCDFRRVRARDAAVIAAVVLGVGSPFSLGVSYLFGPAERMSSLLSFCFALTPNALTAAAMAVFCLTLGIAMFAANHLLRRFLFPESWKR